MEFGKITREVKIHNGKEASAYTTYEESKRIAGYKELEQEIIDLIKLSQAGELVSFGVTVKMHSDHTPREIKKIFIKKD